MDDVSPSVSPVDSNSEGPAQSTTRAVILAAGLGSRLVKGQPYPKPLERVCGEALIVRIIRGLASVGIKEVAVITGHLGEVLRSELNKENLPVTLSYFDNDEFHKPNGTSLLKAEKFIGGPTLLLMSDHLWNPALVQRVLAFPLAADEAVLGVDYDIPRCFDLPDATKVKVAGDRVAEIHKELDDYDCLDTGVFCITPALIESLKAHNGPDGVSLSACVLALSQAGKMRVVDVGTARWIDVDTQEAHAEAERLIEMFGEALG